MNLIILFQLLELASSIILDISSNKGECLIEELGSQSLLSGKFSVEPKERFINFNITDPMGKVVVTRYHVTNGTFAITSQQDGDHYICFWNNATSDQDNITYTNLTAVTINMKTGISSDVYNYEKERTRESISDNVLAMNEITKGVIADLALTRDRETNDAKDSQVAMKEVTVFSIFITVFIVAIGLWEIYYLREFFIYQKVA